MTLGIIGDYTRPLTSHVAAMAKLHAALESLAGYEKIVEGALWDELTGFATELSGHADGLLSAVRLNTPPFGRR